MSVVLQAEQVTIALGPCPLLTDVSLTLNPGDIQAIIGPNGAGKTTLMRALTGDIPLAAGLVEFGGRPLQDWPTEARARQLAFLPQHSLLDFPFPVRDVVAMGRIPHASGRDIDRQIVEQTLAAMDISHLADRLYTFLSGGERQRVQLARVLAQVWRAQDAGQRLLILDEPTSSLDVAHAQQLMQALQKFAATGAAVVCIVHDFNLACRYADRIVAVANGGIAFQGEPAAVITHENLQRVFAVDASVIAHPQNGRPMVFIND